MDCNRIGGPFRKIGLRNVMCRKQMYERTKLERGAVNR